MQLIPVIDLMAGQVVRGATRWEWPITVLTLP